jgi:pimeloyl-ACP methyl ester carboxylesterase
MGGMIAQQLAARHPGSVLSLVSIMSTTGGRRVGQPALKVLPFLVKPPATEREQAIERIVELFGIVGSPGFERDVADTRELAGPELRSLLRPPRGGPAARAILAAGDRESDLRRITAPTLVIHGTDDKMVSASGGKRTAKVIRDARLELIEGMGHDLPRGVWPIVVPLIAAHARRAAGQKAPSAAG